MFAPKVPQAEAYATTGFLSRTAGIVSPYPKEIGLMDEQKKRRISGGWLTGIIVATAIGSFIGTVRHSTVLGFAVGILLNLLVGLVFALVLLRR